MNTVEINGRVFGFKIMANGIKLYDNETLFAFLADSPNQGTFFVTASDTEEGPRYMFSTCSMTEKMLGLYGVGYLKTSEFAQATAKHIRALNNVSRET